MFEIVDEAVARALAAGSERRPLSIGVLGNAADVLDLPERFEAKIQLLVDEMRPFFGDDPVLALYGTDHAEPDPTLAALVARANDRAADGHRIELTTLAGYFGSVTAPDRRPRWRGELRSGARANLLPGVVSARIDLKAADVSGPYLFPKRDRDGSAPGFKEAQRFRDS